MSSGRAELLRGHATIDRTMRYAHLSRNKLHKAVGVLDPLTPADGSAPAVVTGK